MKQKRESSYENNYKTSELVAVLLGNNINLYPQSFPVKYDETSKSNI
jgi:hypothetical protein